MGKNDGIWVSTLSVGVCLAGAAILTCKGFVFLALLLCGMGLGYVLQRSRFCIFSAFTDLLLFKDGALFRALLVFILVSSTGFFLVELTSERQGFAAALGWRTVLGAFLFGCGMVLAGGCAAGTLLRLGEGYALFLPVLAGLIIGSTLGAFHYPFWHRIADQFSPVFFPDLVGWGAAFCLQILCLGLLWLVIKRWENH